MKHMIPKKLMMSFTDETYPVAYAVTDESIDIWLHGVVGDELNQTDSLSVGQLLMSNRGKPVNLRVNSPGGLAYDGIAMHNAILSHDGATTGIIEGMAGSAASLAVIACDKVLCHSGGTFRPHYGMMLTFGHQADIKDALLMLEQLDEELETMYASRSGQAIQKVKKDLMGPHGDGTSFSASAAVAAGYVHEVISTQKREPGKQAAASMMALRKARLSLMKTESMRG